MAHFIGAVHGNRRETSRLGTKKSGVSSYVNGWQIGGNVEIEYDEENDKDVINFTLTRGSSNNRQTLFLGSFVLDGNEFKRVGEIREVREI